MTAACKIGGLDVMSAPRAVLGDDFSVDRVVHVRLDKSLLLF